jgi:hypothetical protein
MRTFNFDLQNNTVNILDGSTELASVQLPAGFFLGEEGSNINLRGSVSTYLLNNGIVRLTGDEETLLIGTLNQALT